MHSASIICQLPIVIFLVLFMYDSESFVIQRACGYLIDPALELLSIYAGKIIYFCVICAQPCVCLCTHCLYVLNTCHIIYKYLCIMVLCLCKRSTIQCCTEMYNEIFPRDGEWILFMLAQMILTYHGLTVTCLSRFDNFFRWPSKANMQA